MRCALLYPRDEIAGVHLCAIGGQPYRLKMTLDGMSAFLTECPQPGNDEATFRAVWWALLRYSLPDVSLRQAGRIASGAALAEIGDHIRAALALGMVVQVTERPEGETAAVDWWNLWAFGTLDLGLDSDRFWALSPRQFFALVERSNQRLRQSMIGTSQICSLLANIHRPEGHRPYTVEDYLPKVGRVAGPEADRQRRLENVKRFRSLMGAVAPMAGIRLRRGGDGA